MRATREPKTFSLNDLDRLDRLWCFAAGYDLPWHRRRALAFLQGRAYVTPQDVKDVAYDVLRHRMILTYEAEAEQKTTEDVIREILAAVPVP